MRDPFESDREDNSVREQWAKEHDYSHGTCRIHGGFWSDSGEGCPQCEPEPEPDEEE